MYIDAFMLVSSYVSEPGEKSICYGYMSKEQVRKAFLWELEELRRRVGKSDFKLEDYSHWLIRRILWEFGQ